MSLSRPVLLETVGSQSQSPVKLVPEIAIASTEGSSVSVSTNTHDDDEDNPDQVSSPPATPSPPDLPDAGDNNGASTGAGAGISPQTSQHAPKLKDRRAELCGKHPAVRIFLRNMTSLPMQDGKNFSTNTTAIVIRSYEAMHSNLTMLSNVTNDHAAPIFLKEIAPAVYSSLLPDSSDRHIQHDNEIEEGRGKGRKTQRSKSFRGEGGSDHKNKRKRTEGGGINNKGHIEKEEEPMLTYRYVRKGSAPVYRLYSHPLPKINYTNQIYIERGYLGATIIVLYMLITTIISVRSVTQLRRTGVKLQLHMAGVLPVTYWCCNFFADACIVLISLLSVYLAVYVGGEPISNYFLNIPPYGGLLFLSCICVFSYAVVASSYAFAVRSADQLSSQLLMLISTVAGGVFLKLFLDRHHNYPYTLIARICMWMSPCFAFSTCMFEMFDVTATEMSVKMGAVVDDEVRASLDKVFHGIFVMAIQAVAYLTVTVILDSYWARMQAAWGHLTYLAMLPLRYTHDEYACCDRLDGQEDHDFDVSNLSPTLHREGSEERLNDLRGKTSKTNSVQSAAALMDGVRAAGALSVTSPLLAQTLTTHRNYSDDANQVHIPSNGTNAANLRIKGAGIDIDDYVDRLSERRGQSGSGGLPISTLTPLRSGRRPSVDSSASAVGTATNIAAAKGMADQYTEQGQGAVSVPASKDHRLISGRGIILGKT